MQRQLIIGISLYRHGAQNAHDSASKATLENEFGTHNDDECITKILEQGTLQETEVSPWDQVADVLYLSSAGGGASRSEE